jgi:hypothetical protein
VNSERGLSGEDERHRVQLEDSVDGRYWRVVTRGIMTGSDKGPVGRIGRTWLYDTAIIVFMMSALVVHERESSATADARAEKTGLPGIARTQGKRGDFENSDGQNRH